MMLEFAWPWALGLGLPLLITTLAVTIWQGRSSGRFGASQWLLLALRAIALLLLILLLAQPMLVQSLDEPQKRPQAIVLFDVSESMSLREAGKTRYQLALDFARTKLLPALSANDFEVQAISFAEDAEPKSGPELAALTPAGKKTNLARALTVAVSSAQRPPVAIFALTDGATNVDQDQRRGLAAMADSRVPFVGIGVGADVGPITVGIQYLDAPARVAPNQEFRLAVQLESGGAGALPPLELLLLRDEKLIERKTLEPQSAGRVWRESFPVTEQEPGNHRYRVELLPPSDHVVRMQQRHAEAQVLVTAEKELRVLFVQSALTWDYKFLRLALQSDPSIRLAGLSRTSNSSFYYQDYESTEATSGGLPKRLEDLAPYSVVILSSMRHSDLTTEQQEMLARYVSELGGGLLMIGGGETFDSSWKGSPLEKLLAVRFAESSAMNGPRFALKLSESALQHPAFQLGGESDSRSAWESVAAFVSFANVDEAKPGATIWATHPSSQGPRGPRILMASQRYGAGQSGVICVQDFWRWRLAKDGDPRHFDRFWQQWLRHLADSQRENLTISILDQQLRVGGTVKVEIGRPRSSQSSTGTNEALPYDVFVRDPNGQELLRQSLTLSMGQDMELTFKTAEPGIYTIEVSDRSGGVVASRTIEIRDENLEWLRPTRVMDTLQQWATLSGGLARKIEHCDDAQELVREVIDQRETVRRQTPDREPLGMNAGMLLVIASCLATEWVLRKRWGKA
jgi:hypothetical protein